MSKSIEANSHGRAQGETSTKAEANRLAARRRFLLGGAAALPIIVTLGGKQAFAASIRVCASAGMYPGQGFSKTDHFSISMYCRP